jgi:hypothetical protein
MNGSLKAPLTGGLFLLSFASVKSLAAPVWPERHWDLRDKTNTGPFLAGRPPLWAPSRFS